jgi:hypothetical protein
MRRGTSRNDPRGAEGTEHRPAPTIGIMNEERAVQMTDVQLMDVIAEQVQKEVARQLDLIAKATAALEQLTKQLLENEALHHQTTLLKLAEIERLLGIDPAASEIDTNYRN